MRTLSILRLAAVVPAVILLSTAASAASPEPKHLGTFTDWNAFTYQENGKSVCYVSTQAKKREPAKPERKDTLILVTHRPADKSLDVVSVLTGTPLKKDAEPKLEIGDRTLPMFADGQTAWARDAGADKAIVVALKRGKDAVLKAEGTTVPKITDTYSLAGFFAAMDAIDRACKISR